MVCCRDIPLYLGAFLSTPSAHDVATQHAQAVPLSVRALAHGFPDRPVYPVHGSVVSKRRKLLDKGRSIGLEFVNHRA